MKVSRHAKIIELISQYDIETQEELAEYLNNAGFKVTQATVSRDIRDLNIKLLLAQNILVIKTVAGMAMAVAAAVDAMKWNEVVGCIAGDDTIMCAIRTVEDTAVVMENIRKLVSRKA